MDLIGQSDIRTRAETQGQADTWAQADAQARPDDPVTTDTRSRANRQSGVLLGAVLLIVGAVWLALFIARVHAHQGTVDDYLYAGVTRGLWRSDSPLNALLHTGQNAPLVPFLAIPGVALFGLYGAMSVELPILLMLCAGAFVLSRQWLSPAGAAITTLAVGLNAAVLSYSVMLNFALASTAAVLWCFAAYARCNRFSHWKWSIAFGFALALLLLSRSVAPVYAVPLVVFVAVDLFVGIVRNGQRPGWPTLAAVGTTLVVAGPWWLVSGSQAIDYLTNAGYQASSGYTSGGIQLSAASVINRIRYELWNLGWPESVALGVLLLAALWLVLRQSRLRRVSGLATFAVWLLGAHELANLGWLESVGLGVLIMSGLWIVVRHSRERRLPGLWILAAWIVATLLFLSSSGNLGTAFGLPLIAVTIVLCAVVIGATIEIGLPALAASVMVLLVVVGASQFTSANSYWWHGPPYRGLVLQAGGSSRTNVDQLDAQVAASLGPGNAIDAVNTGIMNTNDLNWNLDPNSTHVLLPTGPGSDGQIVSMLPHTRSLITGTMTATYDPFIDGSTIEKAAFQSGMHPAREWNVPNGVHVILWNRGPNVVRSIVDPKMVLPRNGSELTRDETSVVATTESIMGLPKVRFLVAGNTLSHPVETVAEPFLYGWIARLNVSTLPKGKYSVTCVAQYMDGVRASSRAITVYVK